MADTTFTILGMTGAGKTCYLLSMYYKMCGGMRGYMLTTDDDTDVNLRKRYARMCDSSLGANRFPPGTDSLSDYEFNLEYAFKPIMSFAWKDYPGGALAEKNDGSLADYTQIKSSIMNSSALFICVDGELLAGDDIDDKIDDLKDNCGNVITPFFSKYLKENKKLPPTAIVITKYDKCKEDTDEEELCEILEEVFSPFFVDDGGETQRLVTVIPVSVGKNIESDDYAGKLKPINIHLPIFMGIWFGIQNTIETKYAEIEALRQIKENKEKISKEKDRFFLFRNNDAIKDLENRIESLQRSIGNPGTAISEKINKLKDIINTYKKYGNRLLKELDKIDILYVNGERQESFSKYVDKERQK